METVDKFLRKLPPEELEHMKLELMRELLKRKSLERWKFKGRYIVAVDGTGLLSFDHEPFEGCPKKPVRKGILHGPPTWWKPSCAAATGFVFH